MFLFIFAHLKVMRCFPYVSLFFKKFLPEDMLMDFREGKGRERERKKNIDVREKHLSVASHIHPNLGPNWQPRHVPWPENDPAAFWFMGSCSHQQSHTGQGPSFSFLKFYSSGILHLGLWYILNEILCETEVKVHILLKIQFLPQVN